MSRPIANTIFVRLRGVTSDWPWSITFWLFVPLLAELERADVHDLLIAWMFEVTPPLLDCMSTAANFTFLDSISGPPDHYADHIAFADNHGIWSANNTANATGVITWQTQTGGRNAGGHTHVPALPDQFSDGGNIPNATWEHYLLIAGNEAIARTRALTTRAGGPVLLGVVHYRNAQARRDGPYFSPFIACTAGRHIGTLRRRLG